MVEAMLVLATLTQVLAYSCNSSNNQCFAWRNDGYCDSDCSSQICNFDSSANISAGSNYDVLKESDCFSRCIEDCSKDMLTNDVCDEECNIGECGYDAGACGFCLPGCKG